MVSSTKPENPLIVQGDHTVLLEVDSPLYPAARDALASFAELVKSPEHIHTYRITPLSIWNACAARLAPSQIIAVLCAYAKYPLPENVVREIEDFASRYGRLKLLRRPPGLILTATDAALAAEIAQDRRIAFLLGERAGPAAFLVPPENRGRLKQALIKIGYPVEDIAGYVDGEALPLSLRSTTRRGLPFSLRSYQRGAASVFHAKGSVRGGSGVIVLPCGAGKTIVGMACMAEVQASTLILATNVTAVRQWIEELLDKTTLSEDQVGEYSGAAKDIRPVTISTYQMMTHRPSRDEEFKHLALFDRRNWGLIVYDEVHLLPAPVFQVTASIQARRRLGLTATLVREDGREDDVFALIGPKKADVPWKELEAEGWIATARCTEIRLPLPENLRMPYALADARRKFRIAAENPAKIRLVGELMGRHREDQVVVIGMYLDQIRDIARRFDLPLITGSTSQKKRDRVFAEFRSGSIRALAVSKVANFSVDLPDASVAIQISGTYGSRQEEAQRLGRILRPKEGANQAFFYTLVSRDTVEQILEVKRQVFL
jgi:DNA excision repair protein ERCC-3